MEKRFELFEEELDYWIYDHETKKNYGLYAFDLSDLEKILNEQDEKVKELEEQLESMTELRNNAVEEAIEKKQQLKQSQNGKAIEVLESVKAKFGYKHNSQLLVNSKDLCDFVNNQLSELRGGR